MIVTIAEVLVVYGEEKRKLCNGLCKRCSTKYKRYLGADCLVVLRRQGDESQGRVYSNANNLA